MEEMINSHLQVFLRRQEGNLYDQRHRESGLYLPQTQPPEKRLPERSGTT